jgi:predicted AAA+ superfamily ATPase
MQYMISRLYTRQVREKLARFPAVALLGPRQCGKTTLARAFRGTYYDMETEGSRARLDAEWDRCASEKNLVVIDEAQLAPEVFSRLRGTIDADRKRNGRFLLLGSVSPALMTDVSESLAGRIGIVHMGPFILPELKARQMDDLWLRGGYPDGGILSRAMFPEWQTDYLEALASRDLPTWGLPAKPQQTLRLLAMLAAVHGQPLNASQLGGSLSLDHKTILSYCDLLEGAFLIRRLRPYHANVRKRLVKTAKVYWRDSGLLHAQMGVTDLEHLYRQPWLGQSWEGFVIEQTLATISGRGIQARPYYFRTSDGYELDLVLDWGSDRWAIEIKLTSNPSRGDSERLQKTAEMIDADRQIMVCRIARSFENDRLFVTNPSGWLRRLSA